MTVLSSYRVNMVYKNTARVQWRIVTAMSLWTASCNGLDTRRIFNGGANPISQLLKFNKNNYLKADQVAEWFAERLMNMNISERIPDEGKRCNLQPIAHIVSYLGKTPVWYTI